MGWHQKEQFILSMEDDVKWWLSSVFEVQVQEKHLEEILLEACNPNLDIMIK